jgi:hypothetical protein
MSPWLDLLLNVIAIAGFLAVATYHRPAKKGDGHWTEPSAALPPHRGRQAQPLRTTSRASRSQI